MPHIHHVICLFYSVTNACFAAINGVLDIVQHRSRRPLPAAAARGSPPAARLLYCVLVTLFKYTTLKKTAKIKKNVPISKSGEDEACPAAVAQDGDGPPAAGQDGDGLPAAAQEVDGPPTAAQDEAGSSPAAAQGKADPPPPPEIKLKLVLLQPRPKTLSCCCGPI